MADTVPESTNALIVTQADVNDLDRAAVTRFHDIQIKRIIAGDKTLGDNRDVIEQAFAQHRIEAERRALQARAGVVRIYVRWSDDGQHIRHWSREPFKHGLNEAQPVDAVTGSIPFAKLFDTPDGQILVTHEYDEDEHPDAPFRLQFRGQDYRGTGVSIAFGWPDEQRRDAAFASVDQARADSTARELASTVRRFMSGGPGL